MAIGWAVRVFKRRVLGHKSNENRSISEVSKTIESLPFPNNWHKGIWGGAIHFAPALAVAIIFLILRNDRIVHDAWSIAASFVAISWLWIGPSCIWFYEKKLLPQFDQDCKTILMKKSEYLEIRSLINANIYNLRVIGVRVFYFVAAVWLIAIPLGIYLSNSFWMGFGIGGTDDFFFWLAVAGILLLVSYTSLGFCFSIKSAQLVYFVSKYRLTANVYHPDGVFGLSFIGSFIAKTSLMLATGIAFAPIFFLANRATGDTSYHALALVLIFYSIFSALAFLLPVYAVSKRIRLIKNRISNHYSPTINSLRESLRSRFLNSGFQEFSFYRHLLLDAARTRNWPLNLEAVVGFSVTAVIIPLLVSIAANWAGK